MRKTSIARLSLLLFVLVFSNMAAPSHAFPFCPAAPCSYYYSLCIEMGGTFNRSAYPGWCQDENFYLRGYGKASCTAHGMTYEFGECAD